MLPYIMNGMSVYEHTVYYYYITVHCTVYSIMDSTYVMRGSGHRTPPSPPQIKTVSLLHRVTYTVQYHTECTVLSSYLYSIQQCFYPVLGTVVYLFEHTQHQRLWVKMILVQYITLVNIQFTVQKFFLRVAKSYSTRIHTLCTHCAVQVYKFFITEFSYKCILDLANTVHIWTHGSQSPRLSRP